MDNFKDKTVVITGGSEGVGAAAARKFAAAGAKLILVARGRKKLEEIAEELRSITEVQFVTMDVSDIDACMNLFRKAEFEFGAVHILVNNAGCHKRGLAESVAAEDLGRMIDVNLKAPIILSRLALPYLRKAEGGAAIINVTSLAGRAPIKGSATYSASKFGLRTFTFALAEELRGTNIKVAAVSPGPIENCAAPTSRLRRFHRGPSIPVLSWKMSMKWPTLLSLNRSAPLMRLRRKFCVCVSTTSASDQCLH